MLAWKHFVALRANQFWNSITLRLIMHWMILKLRISHHHWLAKLGMLHCVGLLILRLRIYLRLLLRIHLLLLRIQNLVLWVICHLDKPQVLVIYLLNHWLRVNCDRRVRLLRLYVLPLRLVCEHFLSWALHLNKAFLILMVLRALYHNSCRLSLQLLLRQLLDNKLRLLLRFESHFTAHIHLRIFLEHPWSQERLRIRTLNDELVLNRPVLVCWDLKRNLTRLHWHLEKNIAWLLIIIRLVAAKLAIASRTVLWIFSRWNLLRV